MLYPPTHEKYIHIFALCSASVDVFALASYSFFLPLVILLVLVYHALLRRLDHAIRTVIDYLSYGSVFVLCMYAYHPDRSSGSFM